MKLRNSNETKQTPNIMQKIARLEANEVIQFLQGSKDGLSGHEIEKRQEKYGKNKPQTNGKHLKLKFLRQAFVTPFTLVLLILTAISFCTNYLFVAQSEKDLSTVIIMITMVIISGTISFVQNVKTNDSVESLLNMISDTITVKRDNQENEIKAEELVPGDISKLSSGDVVPADIRLLSSKDLFCSTASLNGESQPIKKNAAVEKENKENALDLSNIIYEGSAILSGFGTGIVVATGKDTIFGNLAKEVNKKEIKNTTFDDGIKNISKLLLTMTAVIVPIVFLLNGLTKGNWLNALIFAIATAVGLTPEMLPVIVTSNLVKGSVELSKKGTIVKKIDSMQNFGSIDVLCTDKTGTLTEEKVRLDYFVNLNGQSDQEVLRQAYLNSEFQAGNKNLIDQAIIEVADRKIDTQCLEKDFKKINEIPFDFKRRRLSVIVKNNDETYLITKGAAEEMVECASKVEVNGSQHILDGSWQWKIDQMINEYNQKGFRIVLIGYKKIDNSGEVNAKDEQDLILTGMLAFIDPPKESTKETLKQLKRDGISVKILTGDNEAVTRNIAQQVGLDASKVYSESDFNDKTDQEMKRMVESGCLFVKLSPTMKAKIIELLKENDHCVAYMGDGINDAVAMKAADVAISVESGADIAKQCADIILLKKDLRILDRGVKIGRKVFGNTMKYIKITLSSNFGNILSILVASSFLPFLPMLPLQLLVLDLMYGTSCLSIPFDKMDGKYLEIPRKWEIKKLPKFMFYLGPTSSIFDIITFALLYFYVCPQVVGTSYAAATTGQKAMFAAVFCTGWFIESLWTQEMIVQVLRAPGMPFIKQKSTMSVIIATIGVALIGTFLPYSTLGRAMNFVKIPVYYLVIVAILLCMYILLTSIIKKLYLRQEHDLI